MSDLRRLTTPRVFRVSDVESFRQWEADEDLGLAWMLSRLRGDESPSQAMLAGTAFHTALERVVDGVEYDELRVGDYVFRLALDVALEVAPIREQRQHKVYVVDGRPIVITGCVDALDGLRIDDHKTTAYVDPDRYLAGYQWRLYLDIFGAEQFRWNVFRLKEAGEDEPLGTYDVTEYHRLEQWRYPALAEDCQALVTRFARFVRDQGLA